MSKFLYLALGYSLFWIALGVFMLSMHQKVQRLGEYLEELRGRADTSGHPGGRPPAE